MKKYWATARAGFLASLVYRADTFLWGFAELLDTLVFLFIWVVLFGEKQAIGGFNLAETVTYMIGVGVISNILDTWVSYDIESDIQSGQLSNVLIKPVRYFFARSAIALAGKPLPLLIRLVVYALVAFFFKEKFIFNQDILIWILSVFSITFAYLINFLVDFFFGCLAFWTTTIRGVRGVLRTVKLIFSGGYAPLSFFPSFFQAVALLLPFAYTRYFPMLIYLDKLSTMETIKGLLVQVFWIGVLMVLVGRVWKKGLRRYEGVGI